MHSTVALACASFMCVAVHAVVRNAVTSGPEVSILGARRRCLLALHTVHARMSTIHVYVPCPRAVELAAFRVVFSLLFSSSVGEDGEWKEKERWY